MESGGRRYAPPPISQPQRKSGATAQRRARSSEFLLTANCGSCRLPSAGSRTRDHALHRTIAFIGVPSGLMRVAGSTRQDRDYTTDESATRAGAHRGRITRVHRVDPAPITEARDGEVNIVQSCGMH
jgi:hypothetical protein